MTTLLPVDEDSHPIPALRLRSDGAHTINATATSARNAIAFDEATKVVSLFATGPIYARFGADGVTAAETDHYFPQGLYYDFAVSGGEFNKGPRHTHVAVRAADTDCTVYISERE
ncbi:MAG TPA: hypothetical protein VFS88_08035 [Micavibrio sp.]|nr:hypothetical protein [Micavibrio sp.]